MTKIADLPDFDMAEWLPDEAAVAEYLTVDGRKRPGRLGEGAGHHCPGTRHERDCCQGRD